MKKGRDRKETKAGRYRATEKGREMMVVREADMQRDTWWGSVHRQLVG